MEQTKQSEIIRVALENVKGMVDANAVTGEPIKTENGTVIIPVSKISVGLATGGVDFFGKKSNTDKNFGGGGGTGVSVSPVAFLIVDKFGKVDILNLTQEPKDAVSKIVTFIENSPELIDKFKKLFSSSKKKKEEEK
ncbi:MAG: sporulation protein YtfJ [Clostridia bacterium]|nr:sporulation protein YtfJ [Clostridia bacterium]